MNEIITLIGSFDTDIVIRPVRVPARGETVTGGDFEMYRGSKGANKAVAAARLEGTSTLQIKKPIVFLDEYNPGTQENNILLAPLLLRSLCVKHYNRLIKKTYMKSKLLITLIICTFPALQSIAQKIDLTNDWT